MVSMGMSPSRSPKLQQALHEGCTRAEKMQRGHGVTFCSPQLVHFGAGHPISSCGTKCARRREGQVELVPRRTCISRR